MNTVENKRARSVDIARGFVMVLMALDHVRDYFHYDSFLYDPTDLSKTTIPLFFTRFITHFCAPAFCFLAGTSAFLTGAKKNMNSLSAWLIIRGIWLIILELSVVNFGWYFKFNTSFIDLSVIWSLGVSMIFLAGLIRMPKPLSIGLALFLVFGHNLLDSFNPAADDVAGKLWYVFHIQGEFTIGSVIVYSMYPLLPWIGLMTLGYYSGQFFLPSYNSKKRKQLLFRTGVLLIVLFFLFRGSNVYGDLHPWVKQNTIVYTFLSLLNVSKYPPSFSYICITMGPVLILLAATENFSHRLSRIFITIGQVPLFFYLLHIYVIHLAAMMAAGSTGYRFSDMILNAWFADNSRLKGYGFSLPVFYLIWLLIITALYPVCKSYLRYKKNNKQKWWLAYL